MPLQIADFGMSRDLIDHNYYITSGGKIPVKWTAPEVCVTYNSQLTHSNIHSTGTAFQEVFSSE